MTEYTMISQYIDSKTTTLERINAYDNIISQLILKMGDAALANGDIISFSLDDGQTKIQTMYRSVESIEESIKALERAKNALINRYNGRVYVLRGGRLC